MKLSIIATIILLAITLYVGLQFEKKIVAAKNLLQDLKETADRLHIPTNSDAVIDVNEHREELRKENEVRELTQLSQEIAQTFIQLEQSTDDDYETRNTLGARYVDAQSKLIDYPHEKLNLLVRIMARDPALDEETRITMIKQVLLLMSMERPETTADLVLQVARFLELKPKDSAPLIRSVVMEYVLRKPFDASLWLSLNEENLVLCFDDLQYNLLTSMAEKDPSSALKFLPRRSKSRPRPYYAFGIGLTATNAKDFFKALRNHSLSKKNQDNLNYSLTTGPFVQDFDSAVKVLESGALTTAERDRFFSALFFTSLRAVPDDDLTKWLSYLVSEPKTEGIDFISKITLLLPNLIERDYRSMGTWISDLPKSTFKREWLKSYLKIVSPHAPDAAAEFAKRNNITNE